MFHVVTIKFIKNFLDRDFSRLQWSLPELNKMIAKMNTKNLMVFFVAIVSALFLISSISAAANYSISQVEVDGVSAVSNDASVVAGETVTVEVMFTSYEHDTDVTVKAEIEGKKVDFSGITSAFDVEKGKVYKKTLTLNVPYELKDEVSDDLDLTVTIDGKDSKKFESPVYTVRVQRPSYNAEIKSVTVANSADAGETVPVDFVIKNRGYNNLDDLYVTVSMPALGIEKTSYLDDLVTLDNCTHDCDKEDTVSGRITLVVPYEAKAGIYALEVKVSNDDTNSVAVKQIVVNNDYTSNVVVASTKKTVEAGETAEYDLLLVNPTNKLKVYRVVPESSADVASSVEQSIVAVSAGSSKSVKVMATADEAGEYNFNVNVFSGETLTSKAVLSMSVDKESSIASPIVVLAVILSIVFIVLLVVLIVLITKRPEKTEEFGESYY